MGAAFKHLTRRQFMHLTLATGAVVIIDACAAPTLSPSPTARGSSLPGSSPTPGSPVPLAGTLQLYGWGFRKDLVDASLQDFARLYNSDAEFVVAPGGAFEPFIEARYIGGARVDLAYTQIPFLNKWTAADWVQPVADFPGSSEQLAAMYPNAAPAFTDREGKLLGLPYYYANDLFGYNKDHLDRAKLQPPETWDELIEQARQLKRDGISRHPYIGFWTREIGGLNRQFFCDCFAEGDPVFDENADPTFADGGGVVQSVLERYKLLFDEGLTPPDALTIVAPGPVFATGDPAFFTAPSYAHRPTSGDPEFSKVAGKEGFALYPGKTHEVIASGTSYSMGKNTLSQEHAWNLMQFMGGKATDGQYHHIRKWILEAGLSNPYPEVMESPEVVESLRKWVDIDVWNQQARLTRPRTVEKELWFSEFDTFFPGQIHEYILGNLSLGEVMTALADKAKELKQAIGG